MRKVAGNTLTSRDEAIKLFRLLSIYCREAKEIKLDFEDLEFMSRSFADQFHKEKMEWIREKNVVVLVENAPLQIIEILQAAAKTQDSNRITTPNTVLYSFTKEEELNQYLQMM